MTMGSLDGAVARSSWHDPFVALLLMSATIERWIIPVLGLSTCPSAFFNFGDSLTDTGSNVNVFPSTQYSESSPYGDMFFEQPAKRNTDGRVVPDFFSLAFRRPLLQPYLQTGAFDYRNGVNFAVSGATASNDSSRSPFYLPLQIAHFVRFKQSTELQMQQRTCFPFNFFLPFNNIFENALYTFEIGGNDIIYAVQANKTPAQIINGTIPAAMTNIANGVKILYENGARRFLIFKVPNAGCSTIIATLYENLPLDEMGCVEYVNQLDQAYNDALVSTIERLRTEFSSASLDLFDYYNANLEILMNPARFGFDPNLTKTACCGAPGVGSHNYNPSAPCGRPPTIRCPNPEQYVNWDGVHFTEAFYRVIARFALDGLFTDLGINYTNRCFLDFSNFGSSATFSRVYPATCDVTSS